MPRAKADNRLLSIPIFSQLSKAELQRVSSLMTQVDLPAGTFLTKQGQAGQEFFVIIEGRAAVRRGGRKVAEIGPGDFTGELSLISGLPRTADVVAITDISVEALNAREFSSLLDENASITKKILVAAIKRLHEIERSRTS